MSDISQSSAIGGIDLGGTKIEARLFDAGGAQIAARRIATPKADFAALVAALLRQIDCLTAATGAPDLPIGIALPGIADPVTGAIRAANLPLAGHDLSLALRTARSRDFRLLNDAMAFTLSESRTGGEAGGALGGSGRTQRILGLVLGTGLGAGLCIGGALPPGSAGRALEIGHVGLPAAALARHDLPLRTCGCGRQGCTELYVSGPGLARLARHLTGMPLAVETLAAHPQGDAVLAVWADLVAETLATLQLLLAPDAIVFGGGLSNLPGLLPRLTDALTRRRLGRTPLPDLRLAVHGDASGARGAALHAQDAAC